MFKVRITHKPFRSPLTPATLNSKSSLYGYNCGYIEMGDNYPEHPSAQEAHQRHPEWGLGFKIYPLKAQRASHMTALMPKYVLYSHMSYSLNS